jgi:hypothetical protein
LRTAGRKFATTLAIAAVVCSAAACSGSTSPQAAGTRVAATDSHASNAPVVPPGSNAVSGIPARFMPSGGWHRYDGIGEQFLLSITPNGTLNEVTYRAAAAHAFNLIGQTQVHAVTSNLLFVSGTPGVPDFYLRTDETGRLLYETDTPSALADAVIFCAGTTRKAACGASE